MANNFGASGPEAGNRSIGRAPCAVRYSPLTAPANSGTQSAQYLRISKCGVTTRRVVAAAAEAAKRLVDAGSFTSDSSSSLLSSQTSVNPNVLFDSTPLASGSDSGFA